MNLNRIINQPRAKAAAYLADRTQAWEKFDNDYELAIDEAYEKGRVKITGQDGSVIRASKEYHGHHGTQIFEVVENSDGSTNLFWGVSDLSRGWNVKKNADGTFEGVNFSVVTGQEPAPPQRPGTVNDIFSNYSPKFVKETFVKATPMDASEAEGAFKRDLTSLDRWKILPEGLPYNERQEFLMV